MRNDEILKGLRVSDVTEGVVRYRSEQISRIGIGVPESSEIPFKFPQAQSSMGMYIRCVSVSSP